MQKCPECGMIHPLMRPGSCPIARDAKIKEQTAQDKEGTLKEAILTVQEVMVSKLKGKDKAAVDDIVKEITNIINLKSN